MSILRISLLNIIFALLLSLSASCSDADQLDWRILFADDSIREATSHVRAFIVEDDCSSGSILYEEDITEDTAAPSPPDLSSGSYGFAAYAFDADDARIAQGCTDVELPSGEDEIITTLAAEADGDADGDVDGDADSDADADEDIVDGDIDGGDADADIGPLLPDPPVIVTPWNGVATGSINADDALLDSPFRPEVRWLPVEEAQSYVLEMVPCDELDLSLCDFTSPTVRIVTDEATMSARPATELTAATDAPAGQRYAFQVSSCAEPAGVDCAPSERRYIDVGRMRQDVDGDGFGDLFLLGDDGAGVTSLWRNAPVGTFRADAVTLSRDDLRSVGWIGDYDADGFAELAVGARGAAGGSWIYLDNLSESGEGSETTAGANLGRDIAGLDDVDGDGYADFAVTAPGLSEVRVQFGGATFDAARMVSITAPTGVTEFPIAIASAGDRDSDGLADVSVLSRNDALTMRCEIYSVAGRTPSLLESYDIETGESTGEIDSPLSLGRAIDADGDGVPDIPLGRRALNQLVVIFADTIETSGSHEDGAVGASVYSGDLDGTGYGRLVLGAPEAVGMMGISGETYHLRWSGGEFTGVVIPYFNVEAFGQRVTTVDLDADGREDIASMGTAMVHLGLFADGRVGNTADFIMTGTGIERWLTIVQ